MSVEGELFDLKPVVSASGSRYRAVDGTDTGFWSKGERALVTVRGKELPECMAVRVPALPFTARGQEPGWMITIDFEIDAEGRLVLHTHRGECIIARR